ncbi:hypothetical protein JCM10908_003010 [Rhodotorula pacifica]|uniref:Ca(2+)-dependent cysteine protease MCA1 n=1 Tax=Rhodotorula pacifica TaxID=1495444 RepID=UPI00316F1136
MSYPGANYHGHKQQHLQQQQNYGPPPGQYGSSGYGAPPGPPPISYGSYPAPQGPPPGQYDSQYGGSPGQYGGGYDGGNGYNAGYQQQMPHPDPYHHQYQPPPAVAGGNPYPQQYSAPAGPPPTHYGRPSQQFNGPQQYQGGQFDMHYAPPQQMAGYYSNLSGRRKALCIGINYTGTSSALRGCVNDANNVSAFLCERYNYRKEDIVMLLDEPGANMMSIPTRDNMIRAMQWLVKDAQPNDSLFFHYSGHGGQTKATEGDEIDGEDETIYPLDFKTAGMIVDNDLHRLLVKPLPRGCRLTAIFDCCHSGSALDLPYTYSTSGKLKEPNMLADAGSGALGAATSYMRGDMGGVLKSVMGLGKRVMNGDKAHNVTLQTRSSEADVISWSGCKDSQTSADTSMQGQATGAMSWAFITSLTKFPQQTYLQLLNTIRDELRGKFGQKPQLACSHELDLNLIFAA